MKIRIVFYEKNIDRIHTTEIGIYRDEILKIVCRLT